MTIASNLGFPPLGAARELKRATEGYWGGKISREQLLATGAELRRRHWQLQRDLGLGRIPANHFSFYDRMLDTCAMDGADPQRHSSPRRPASGLRWGSRLHGGDPSRGRAGAASD